MPDIHQVIVEFLADTAGLSPAIDKLEQLGKIDSKTANSLKQTSAEFNNRTKSLSQAATQTDKTNKSLVNLSSTVKNLSKDFMEGFQEGVVDELQKAGVSLEEFQKALKGVTVDTGQSTVALRTRIRELNDQLAELKINGQEDTEQFKTLRAEAAKLRDAMGDVNREVNALASDTRVFDGLIDAASGIAGAFSIAQGAAALFGDESKDLQETLLRVQASIAILNGLQQIQNVLQKESAARTLFATLKIQGLVLWQKFLTATTLQSAAATTALRIAIGLLTGGLLLLIPLFAFAGDKSNALDKAFDKLSDTSDDTKDALKEMGDTVNDIADSAISDLRQEISSLNAELGKTPDSIEKATAALKLLENEADRIKKQRDFFNLGTKSIGESLRDIGSIFGITEDRLDKTLKQASELRVLIQKDESAKRIKAVVDEFNTLNEVYAENQKTEADLIIDSNNRILSSDKSSFDQRLAALKSNLAQRNRIISNDLAQSLSNEKDINKRTQLQKKAQADSIKALRDFQDSVKQLNEKAAEENKKIKLQELNDTLAALELERLKTAENTQARIDIEKKIIEAKAKIQLENADLTANQIKLINEQALQDQLNLQKEFDKKISNDSLQAQIDRNQAELQQVEINNEEKLRLTIENINSQAQLEINTAQGNADKIKAITAQRDADIRAAKKLDIENTLSDEIQADQLATAAARREIQRRLADEQTTVNERKGLIDELKNYDLKAIELRGKALNDELAQGLISQSEYNKEYAKLVDDAAKIYEDAEQKKTDATTKGVEERKKLTQQEIEVAFQTASQVVSIIQELYSQQTQKQIDSIESQKQRIQDLQQQGAISEKEAIARIKRLDAEEKRIKQQQAQRDKSLALFSAIINTAEQVTKVIANPVLAAITAALGAAQIALIAARPIPKFSKGKKDQYEGLGEVAERGPEIIEKDGKMYVVQDPTIIWLSKKDKVFTHSETVKMLEGPVMNKRSYEVTNTYKNGISIDYDKIGKSVAKNMPQFGLNVNENGFKEWVRNNSTFTNYLNARRKYGA